jgi:hypothetical protein
MTIHAADVAESRRLQRVVEALKLSPDGLTTREIITRTGTCAVNSVVSELRANGYAIECRYMGKSDEGMRIYNYRLTAPVAAV